MVFKCQEDSFLREVNISIIHDVVKKLITFVYLQFSSIVVSCEKAQLKPKEGSKDAPIDGYNVIFEDTVLFPEGGGQVGAGVYILIEQSLFTMLIFLFLKPSDRGLVNGKPVLNVVRKGAEAIHFVQSDEPFAVGQTAEQRVDWAVRLDHMQQHSGEYN